MSRLAVPALLGATVLGTLANNVLNVPLHDVAGGFGVPVSSGVLVVSAFALTLAVGLALTGWVGDRFGRRRTLTAALAVFAIAMAAAALAPTFGILVAARAVQGLACAAIPPTVMGLLVAGSDPDGRARVMSGWAAANGLGQAIGPPAGGAIADTAGWRGIFWLLAPLAAVLAGLVARAVPPDRGRPVHLHPPGAVALTVGSGLLMLAVIISPQQPGWLVVLLALPGAGALAAFWLASARARRPMVPPRLLVEPRFARSSLAAAGQMFCLAATLVAVPLYLTGVVGTSSTAAGGYVLALPAAMALLAPAVGWLCQRVRPRLVLRTGLLVLAAAELGLGGYFATRQWHPAPLVLLLVAVGAGIAAVQTPAATGATRSPAGQFGTALGIFNMLRFAGSALGAAWVALVYPHGALLALFAGCAAAAGLGLAASFAGPDPAPAAAPEPVTSMAGPGRPPG